MSSQSAGILMYRLTGAEVEVLLVHPGGPFWRHKDNGAWSIPKGELGQGESPAETAQREFEEELGIPPTGALVPLGRIRQRGGKVVEAFALRGDLTPGDVRCSSLVEIEWPRGSGLIQRFPEIDRAAWFPLPEARLRILAAQGELLDRLEDRLANKS